MLTTRHLGQKSLFPLPLNISCPATYSQQECFFSTLSTLYWVVARCWMNHGGVCVQDDSWLATFLYDNRCHCACNVKGSSDIWWGLRSCSVVWYKGWGVMDRLVCLPWFGWRSLFSGLVAVVWGLVGRFGSWEGGGDRRLKLVAKLQLFSTSSPLLNSNWVRSQKKKDWSSAALDFKHSSTLLPGKM